ncbi:MATE family efflux transporter [Sphingorhabdus sp. Alg239-R122]|uniref:MATE family efflux transporter n=1 Tax=Sphingorhabdus sp. Alg239-R122 TaxID=2305989 RepID=UPI0013DA0920|nr:MATE family efflux transporter [Sphingorhabdus sp. Alg239-R122]
MPHAPIGSATGASEAGMDSELGHDEDNAANSKQARFLTGNLMHHVAVMTLTSSFGLLAMFLVDFADLYFISQLGDDALTAGMGFAATLLFFNSALNIGLMIAISALAARRIGSGDAEAARALLTHIALLGVGLSIPVTIAFWVFSPQIMDLFGASGAAKDAAVQYIRIVMPFTPITVLGMVCSGFLRAHGDAKRAMNTTLAMAFTNGIFDPILIFGVGLGFAGAAYSTVLSIFAMAAFGLWPVLRIYGGFAPFRKEEFQANLPAIWDIMIPAVLTNLATPVGGAISFRFIAEYGAAIVAAYALIGRIIPVAFGLFFSLSGAIGPIVGQNFGAMRLDRARTAINNAVLFAAGYLLIIWPLLYLFARPIAAQFNLSEQGQDLVALFGLVVTPLFLFNGILYIANATFNNLDRPRWATWLNWGRNTIGVLPFAWAGSHYYGAEGVLVGPAIGGVLFGLLAYWMALQLVTRQHAAQTAKA